MSTTQEGIQVMTEIATLPLEQLEPNVDNPRERIDPDAEAMQELKASIEEHGILQPLLVGPAGDDGRHPIIAGHRRFVAASDLGLGEVPVLVREDLNGGALAAALTENVLREDLTPIEEAHALEALRKGERLKQAELARRVGKSVDWVRGRLQLLKLPEAAQEAIADGKLPLEAAKPLLGVARVSPQVAEAVVTGAPDMSKLGEPGRVFDALEGIVEGIASKAGGAYLARLGVWNGASLNKASVPDAEQLAKLTERHEAIDAGEWEKRVVLDREEDVDAARAYGCLFTFETPYGGEAHYATDPEWVADRLEQRLEEVEKEVAKARAELEDEEGAELRKVQKEVEERKERAEAYNAELASRLAQKLSRPDLPTDATLDAVKVIALAAVQDHPYIFIGALEAAGTQLPTVDSDDEVAPLIRLILDAKSIEVPVGIVLRGVLWERFTQSPWTGEISPTAPCAWDGGYAVGDEIHELLDSFAEKAGVLPQPALDAVAKWRQERAERAKAREEADQEGEDAEAEEGTDA